MSEWLKCEPHIFVVDMIRTGLPNEEITLVNIWTSLIGDIVVILVLLTVIEFLLSQHPHKAHYTAF